MPSISKLVDNLPAVSISWGVPPFFVHKNNMAKLVGAAVVIAVVDVFVGIADVVADVVAVVISVVVSIFVPDFADVVADVVSDIFAVVFCWCCCGSCCLWCCHCCCCRRVCDSNSLVVIKCGHGDNTGHTSRNEHEKPYDDS